MTKKKDNIEGEETGQTYKVKSLGFANGKRHYSTGNKTILLIEGESISQEDYELFSDYAKEVLFEK